MIEFEGWPKTPRYSSGGVSITEKIDGTNACVIVTSHGVTPISMIPHPNGFFVEREGNIYEVGAQSRKRLITMTSDNAGFARWVWEHGTELVDLLGPGRHFGEWWGQGIQRRYDMDHKVFSLFNYHKWSSIAQQRQDWRNRARDIHMTMVPLLSVGKFTEDHINQTLDLLRENGSFASSEWGHRFDRPEGVIIRHKDLGGNLKAFIENDDVPKGALP